MSKKILIVDDEPDVVKYLETLFNDNGYTTEIAWNGREAYEKAVSWQPDLITLDITMPEESGVRAFRDLQDNTRTNGIPVIIITGVSGEFKRFIATRRQVEPPVEYFEKPIDRKELLGKIEEILNR